MPRNKLTETKIKALGTSGLFGDGDGLYLRVQKGGSRNWIFIYRRGTERVELGLGGYGQGTAPVSLVLARGKAETIRQQLARGEDPRAERKTHKPKTFKACADMLIEAKRPEWTGAYTATEWEVTLRDYAAHLHDMPIADIVVGDVKQALLPIWISKPDAARRVRVRMHAVFDFAIAHGWRTAGNPARWKGLLDKIMAKPAAPDNHHPALAYRLAPAFAANLRTAADSGARCVELILLTAVRSSGAREAVWSEFDFEEKTWTIPKARMKSGPDFVVPLTARAIELLDAQKVRAIDDYVFPGARIGKPISESLLRKAIQAASPDQSATIHGLRSTFRDWAGDTTEFPREIAEAALAHQVGNAAERAYRRGDALDKRRKLMEAWAAYCTGKA